MINSHLPTAESVYSPDVFIPLLKAAIQGYLNDNHSAFYAQGRQRAQPLLDICNSSDWINNSQQGWRNVLLHTEIILSSSSKQLSNKLLDVYCSYFSETCLNIIASRETSVQSKATAVLFNTNKKEFVLKDLIPQIKKDLELIPTEAARKRLCQNTEQTPVATIPKPIFVEDAEPLLSEEEERQNRRLDVLSSRPDPNTSRLTSNPNTRYSTTQPSSSGAIPSGNAMGEVVGAACRIS